MYLKYFSASVLTCLHFYDFQDLNELIEKKACLLKQDAENLDFGDDEEEDEAPVPNGGGSGSGGGGGGNKAAEKKPAGSTTPRPESSQASSAAVSSKTPKTNEKSKNKPAGEDKSAQKRRKKPEKAGKGGRLSSNLTILKLKVVFSSGFLFPHGSSTTSFPKPVLLDGPL